MIVNTYVSFKKQEINQKAMVPFDELYEKGSYGVAHSTVLINVTDFSFNLMSIWCKAACLYMFFSIFLWLTNAHLRSYSLMYHSSFCIMLPIYFLYFTVNIWNENGVLYLRLCSSSTRTLRAYALCVLSCNTSKSVCILPCCTQNVSLLKTLTQYS